MRRRIIHDCDPGNDDALAILVAAGHAGLDLVAVTTGAGHLDGGRTARNAARTMAFTGPLAVPVSAGAMDPLVRDRMIAGILDLETGLDPERPDLPEVDLDRRHSVELMADTLRGADRTTIVTTGPLTNTATLLRTDPSCKDRIERIVALGGAWGLGNKTAAAEWNILCDPEAASIVFSSGLDITLIPVDAAAEVGIDGSLADEVEFLGGNMSAFAAELLRSLVSTFRPGLLSPEFMPLNDPTAPLVAADPGLARTVPARVDVELAGKFTYGRTVVDFAGRTGLPANCDVVIGFDAAATRAAFIGALKQLASLIDSPENLAPRTCGGSE